MQKLSLLLLVTVLLFGCQKEDLTMLTTEASPSIDLKTVNATAYKKVRGSILKHSEYESYCGIDYEYTQAIYINGVEWQYPTSGYEHLMYKGLRHFEDGSNDYFFAGLEYPANGYEYGIGFGRKVVSGGYYPFTSNITISIPDKNLTIEYPAAPCFAIGNASFADTDSIRIVLYKKQNNDINLTPDSVIAFSRLKEILALETVPTIQVTLNASIGEVAIEENAQIYNWIYYNGGTSDVYGLSNAGTLTNNFNFGDGLNGSCSGIVDIYLHQGSFVYKCSTFYSIFYGDYTGSRKQLHIYQ